MADAANIGAELNASVATDVTASAHCLTGPVFQSLSYPRARTAAGARRRLSCPPHCTPTNLNQVRNAVAATAAATAAGDTTVSPRTGLHAQNCLDA
eukprot:365786-Chlamydomonas_euryale.AAC.1